MIFSIACVRVVSQLAGEDRLFNQPALPRIRVIAIFLDISPSFQDTYDDLIHSPYFVASLFFVVAFVYSSIGLGGGSSYTALMAILGFSTLAIPMISHSLNLLVTAIGSFNFIRNGHARLKLILPFLVTSIPMSYLGGSLQLDKEIFY